MASCPPYNKRIREHISVIIENEGIENGTRVFDQEEYGIELKKKLIEGAKELSEANSKEDVVDELADVRELYHAFLTNEGIGETDVDAGRKEKTRSMVRLIRSCFQ